MKLAKLIKKASAPKPSDPYHQLIAEAQKAKSQSRWAEAAELYEQAYGLRESYGVMVQMGHMNKEAGKLEAAEAAYFNALAQKPTDADLNLQIGHFFFVKGDLGRSVEYYRKAIEIEPDNPAYAEHLKIGERRAHEAPFKDNLEGALKALRLGQWAVAEAGLRAVADAGSTDYLQLLGHAVKEQGRMVEAIELYRAHYEKIKDQPGPELLEALVLIGQSLRVINKHTEAASWLMLARSTRMAYEGWVGSVDNLLTDVELCLRRVHPSIDGGYIR